MKSNTTAFIKEISKVKRIIIVTLFFLLGASSFAQNITYKNIQVNEKLQNVLKDSIKRKVINHLDTLFLQIANGKIDKEFIHEENIDLTIAVLKGLQGIKSFDNSTESFNNYHKQLIKFYLISKNTYSISVALINNMHKEESPFIKTIFRLVAENENGKIKFSIPLEYITRKWKSTKVGNINYFYKDTIQLKRARKFNKKNTLISKKLNVFTEQFKFYMCENYQDILKLLGYEYQLESASTYKLGYGVEEGHIFSIMNNEDFSHDVFHYYSGKIHESGNRNWIAEEGIACSWGNAYYVDKNGEMITLDQLVLELKKHFADTKIDLLSLFENDTKIFNHIDSDLSIRTVISGVICNAIEHKKGIEGIISIINSGRTPNSMDAYFKTLNELISINRSNFNIKIRELLKKY